MKATFAKQHPPINSLDDVVAALKPTALIGQNTD
jgi:hypothetical protein